MRIASLIINIHKTLRYCMSYGPVNTLKRIQAEAAWRIRARHAIHKTAGCPKNGLPFNYLVPRLEKAVLGNKNFNPAVSIIVPCYNHATFLRQRLDSIYNQTYANYEVILLDDASGDGSAEILREYAQKFPHNTRLAVNEQNSGSPFRQWRKGIHMAQGELVMIAESDDYCQENFLAALTPFFSVAGVELAYSDMQFIGDGKTVDTLNNYMAPLNRDWGRDFIHTAHEYVTAYLSKKNAIPNVSGVLFRKKSAMPLLDSPEWLNMSLCGDWIFYLQQICGGFIAFSGKTKNYYRIHKASTSKIQQKQKAYYTEHGIVARRLAASYRLSENVFHDLYNSLYKFSRVQRSGLPREELAELFDLRAALSMRHERKPNILIISFALTSGGGEVFPLALAGGLYGRGYPVTVLNAALAPETPGIRAQMNPDMPCANAAQLGQPLSRLINSLGADIVHTHHAVLDQAVNREKALCTDCAHVVTVHGMYEAAFKADTADALLKLEKTVDAWVYIAEKNLFPLLESGNIYREKMHHIPNALPMPTVTPASRKELGLEPGDFVFCLVSRALAGKGWEEAAQATALANRFSARKIKLLLIGSGEMQQRLQKRDMPNVLLLGFKSDVRSYFAMSDCGLLPTRYAGESFPLVVIECLLSGRPVLATRVGEIPYQLSTGANGHAELAGRLLELRNGCIDIKELAAVMVEIADNPSEYARLLANVPAAAGKFDYDAMLNKYVACYHSAIATAKSGVGDRRE